MDYTREIEIKCHASPSTLAPFTATWERRRYNGADAHPFRSCSYCGSMHPMDLLVYLEKGQVDVSGSDWKYGWPHKFYCEVPNPYEGAAVQVGTKWHNGEEEVVMGKASAFLHSKFYALHLNDLNEEEFTALASGLLVHTRILFERREGKLWFSAPRAGYQAWGQRASLFHHYVKDEGLDVETALARAAREMREEMRQQHLEH